MGEYAEYELEREMDRMGAGRGDVLERRPANPWPKRCEYIDELWGSKDGSSRRVVDMEDSHVKNTYHYLIKQGRDQTSAFFMIRAEMKHRGLPID